ncbi:MAG: hypothetical protein JW750_02610 [Anaerolineaceae bacterium]|nr:hypothetical protein [Anaerolineaceae bacterium]
MAQTNAPIITLFDIDGVLITPGGYRQACVDTIEYFLQRLGIHSFFPSEDIFETFESIGITSEWDMVPLYLSFVLNEIRRLMQTSPQWYSLTDAESAIHSHPPVFFDPPSIDNWFEAIRSYYRKASVPSRLVLNARHQTDFPMPFLANQPVLDELLANSRSMARSETLRVFQNHILGSKLYEQTYQREAELDLDCYLHVFDHCTLEDETRKFLQHKLDQRSIRMSAFTARPSLGPANLPLRAPEKYSPEAEQALSLIQLHPMHLSAYGKMIWLADEFGFDPEAMLKPSPVQPLSAIATLFDADEETALRWAGNFYRAEHGLRTDHNWQASVRLPSAMILHVFEDSPIGIQGGHTAAEWLKKLGIDVTYHPWGITTSEKKKASLLKNEAIVYTNTNDAIYHALGNGTSL